MNLEDIIGALEGTPTILARLVHGLPEATLRAGHDADNWSIKEVLGHLRDAEEVALERFTRMAQEDRPFLPAYDQEAYARDRGYQEQDAAQALEGFARVRARSVQLFRGLASDDLARDGVHEETGAISLGEHAEHIIAHDVVHLAQIARVLTVVV